MPDDDPLPTTERLARALEAEGAPEWMINKARSGYYDDYKSPLALPETQLRADALEHGLTSIADGVLNGEWDATKAESDAWAASPEGRAAYAELLEARRRYPR